MQQVVNSNIREQYVDNFKDFNICYINITNYAFIKRLDERITNPTTHGMGHIISNVIWMDMDGTLNYSVVPHNELGTSCNGVCKRFDELDMEDWDKIKLIFEDFSSVMNENNFSKEAIKLFNEFCEAYSCEFENRTCKSK